jgi:molybdate transport system substrate-binding protein
VRPKIVMGQNVGQAFSLVESGAAELGFVASSALVAPGTPPGGERIEIPQELFAPIRQDAVLLEAGRDEPAAAAFLDYLGGARATAIAAAFGYGVE